MTEVVEKSPVSVVTEMGINEEAQSLIDFRIYHDRIIKFTVFYCMDRGIPVYFRGSQFDRQVGSEVDLEVVEARINRRRGVAVVGFGGHVDMPPPELVPLTGVTDIKLGTTDSHILHALYDELRLHLGIVDKKYRRTLPKKISSWDIQYSHNWDLLKPGTSLSLKLTTISEPPNLSQISFRLETEMLTTPYHDGQILTERLWNLVNSKPYVIETHPLAGLSITAETSDSVDLFDRRLPTRCFNIDGNRAELKFSAEDFQKIKTGISNVVAALDEVELRYIMPNRLTSVELPVEVQEYYLTQILQGNVYAAESFVEATVRAMRKSAMKRWGVNRWERRTIENTRRMMGEVEKSWLTSSHDELTLAIWNRELEVCSEFDPVATFDFIYELGIYLLMSDEVKVVFKIQSFRDKMRDNLVCSLTSAEKRGRLEVHLGLELLNRIIANTAYGDILVRGGKRYGVLHFVR